MDLLCIEGACEVLLQKKGWCIMPSKPALASGLLAPSNLGPSHPDSTVDTTKVPGEALLWPRNHVMALIARHQAVVHLGVHHPGQALQEIGLQDENGLVAS